MECTDSMGGTKRLVWKIKPVQLMRFDDATGYWTEDGTSSGVLVEWRTWLSEIWHLRPERELLWRKHNNQQTEGTP
jgi:hypothetical protein